MSQPTPAEDRRLNRAMGQAAVAGDNVRDFVVKRPAIVNTLELMVQREFDLLETARERARKAGLVAYRRSYRDGSYAVPSQSELGVVHDVDLNWFSGQPISCSCEASVRWCVHVGAARLVWEVQKEVTDEHYGLMTEAALQELMTEKETVD